MEIITIFCDYKSGTDCWGMSLLVQTKY